MRIRRRRLLARKSWSRSNTFKTPIVRSKESLTAVIKLKLLFQFQTFMSHDYVNIKFNQKFSPRRRHNVPHIPIMVDKAIMSGLDGKNGLNVYLSHGQSRKKSCRQLLKLNMTVLLVIFSDTKTKCSINLLIWTTYKKEKFWQAF